jgi:dipeptidyl aminopeptidase/acylaminoacyl peptidase
MTVTQVRFLSAPEVDQVATLELAATLYHPAVQPSRLFPGLVVGHGAGSRRKRHDSFCREACRQGFIVLALDFRGHGESDGSGDGPLELDVLAAADVLRRQPGVDGTKLCYRGSSLGGFYGLKAAPDADFVALALLCPAGEQTILEALDDLEGGPTDAGKSSRDPTKVDPEDDPPRWDTGRLRSYFEKQSSELLAARVKCPVLLVHAREDDAVPLTHSLLLARCLSTETTLLALQGGTHTTAQHDPRIHSYSAAWLLAKATGSKFTEHIGRT